MMEYFWKSGHLAWDVFVLIVFSCAWLLCADLSWRLVRVKIGKLMKMVGVGWLIGAGIVLFGFYFATR